MYAFILLFLLFCCFYTLQDKFRLLIVIEPYIGNWLSTPSFEKNTVNFKNGQVQPCEKYTLSLLFITFSVSVYE